MSNKYLFILLPLLLTAGCAVPEPEQEPVKKAPELTAFERKVKEGDKFFREKNYQRAYMLYSEAQKETAELRSFRELQLKTSAACYEMKNYPAALAALSPMPEFPATLNDCKKLVMAARILQKMNGKPEHIESLFEVALDNPVDGPGVIPFKASGYAQLGRVYVLNRKTARALKCFEYAEKLYRMAGDGENAKICRNIVEYLK